MKYKRLMRIKGFTPLNPTKSAFAPWNPFGLRSKFHGASNLTGLTLAELLVVISAIGFIIVSAATAFNIVRMNGRDAVRAENIATIKFALATYLKDSLTGYPASSGECLNASTGVGAELKAAKAFSGVPADPLWPTTAPVHIDGVPKVDQTNFCYYYFSDANDKFKISYFLESKSNAAAGINTVTQ